MLIRSAGSAWKPRGAPFWSWSTGDSGRGGASRRRCRRCSITPVRVPSPLALHCAFPACNFIHRPSTLWPALSPSSFLAPSRPSCAAPIRSPESLHYDCSSGGGRSDGRARGGDGGGAQRRRAAAAGAAPTHRQGRCSALTAVQELSTPVLQGVQSSPDHGTPPTLLPPMVVQGGRRTTLRS